MNPNELFPQVYDELRKLAASKMRMESPAPTLDATALIHEVFLKLEGDERFLAGGRGGLASDLGPSRSCTPSNEARRSI